MVNVSQIMKTKFVMKGQELSCSFYFGADDSLKYDWTVRLYLVAKTQKLLGFLKLDMNYTLFNKLLRKTSEVSFRRKCGLYIFFKNYFSYTFFSL